MKMDDLPQLPFEKILAYLPFEDRIKLRGVSRRWCRTISSFRPASLFYSETPISFIIGKNRLTSGPFAQNVISSPKFESFFNTFRNSILSNLKRLRLSDLDLNAGGKMAFSHTLKSFSQLEELGVFRCGNPRSDDNSQRQFKLNLPALRSLQLESLGEIKKLTLDAPRLLHVKIWECHFSMKLDFIHAESVERLVLDNMSYVKVEKLTNLKYLICNFQWLDPTFLSSLQQLKEIHVQDVLEVPQIFAKQQQFGPADLKVYVWGLLLDGPNDPVLRARIDRPWEAFVDFSDAFHFLAKNPSRLAADIPFIKTLSYEMIKLRVSGSEIPVLNRLPDLSYIAVHRPESLIDQPLDIQRFLDILKNYGNIAKLWFSYDQPQELFDRLPEHCSVQHLRIDSSFSDLSFLCRLTHLVHLNLACATEDDQLYETEDRSIDAEPARRVLEELPFLLEFKFKHLNHEVRILINRRRGQRRFLVRVNGFKAIASDSNAAIQIVIERTRPNKRKAEVLE